MTTAQIQVVVVSYDSAPELKDFVPACLDRLSSPRILVVENGSTLHAPWGPELDVLHTGENTGYFGGLRRGLAWLSEEATAPPPDWYLCCNPDVAFVSSNIERALDEVALSTAVIAPAITDQRTRRPLNPLLVEPPPPTRFLLLALLAHTGLLDPALRARRTLLRDRKPQSRGNVGTIFAPHGAAFFIRGNCNASALLSHDGFLYGEEVSMATTAQELGMQIEYRPDIQLEHFGSTSVDQLESRVSRSLKAQGFLHTWRVLRGRERSA